MNRDIIYNIIGCVGMVIGLYLCFAVRWPEREPMPKQDYGDGYGDDDYIVRWDSETGEPIWGEGVRQ